MGHHLISCMIVWFFSPTEIVLDKGHDWCPRHVGHGRRLMFFEQAREQEEAKWKANKQDSVVR